MNSKLHHRSAIRALSALGYSFALIIPASALRADPPAATPPSQEIRVKLGLESGTGEAKPDPFAINLQALLETAINDPHVKVVVRAVLPGRYVAVLSGKPIGVNALQRARDVSAKVKDDGHLDSLVIVDAMQQGNVPSKDPTVSYRWAFGYLLGDSAFDGKQDLSKLAEAFNFLFPTGTDNPPLVTLKNTEFLLQGPENMVRSARGLLMLIDAPAPQVRLEMWAIQYAGSQQGIGKQLKLVAEDIRGTQSQVDLAKYALVDAVHQHAPELINEPTFKQLHEVGFNINPASSLSLMDALLCIGISEHRRDVIDDAKKTMRAILKNAFPLGSLTPQVTVCSEIASLQDLARNDFRLFARLTDLLAPPVTDSKGVDVPDLHALSDRTLASDAMSVRDFAEKLKRYYLFMDALEFYGPSKQTNPSEFLNSNPSAPEDLALASMPINRHIEHLVNAFAADMEAMYFQPLLTRAQNAPNLSGGGVGLAGRTRIVVTSRLPASVVPSIVTYAEKQVPRTLSADFIPNLLNSAKAGPGGVATLLPGLTNLEQGLVLAALQPTADVSYYQVAPGISVKVTPAMTPDGTNANLNMDVTFGVETSIHKDTGSETVAYRPPDAVKSHHVQTTATVGGFNLFDMSSFNMETVTPRAPFIFPVLGNLPLIGNMFRFSHSPNHTFHQSIILTNATLVPRGLGLVNLYGSNFAGTQWLRNGSAATKNPSGKVDTQKFLQ